MAARLGNVLYWGASLIAVLLIALLFIAHAFGSGEGDKFLQAMVLVTAVAIWLIGRACRYVLAGK